MLTRRISVLAVVFGLVASLIGAQSHAAIITWSGAPIAATGTTTISTVGALVEAHNVGDATALAAGGVTFDALDVNTLGFTFTGANPLNIAGNANFDSILNSASYSNTTVNYLVDNLVNGTPYLVQFFVADSRAAFGLRTVTYSDGVGNSLTSGPLGAGFAFTGQFTAIGTTQNIVISGSGPFGETVPYMNAWQLRNVTGVQPIPEPTTLCVWAGLGLVAACGAYKRRRATKAAH